MPIVLLSLAFEAETGSEEGIVSNADYLYVRYAQLLASKTKC